MRRQRAAQISRSIAFGRAGRYGRRNTIPQVLRSRLVVSYAAALDLAQLGQQLTGRAIDQAGTRQALASKFPYGSERQQTSSKGAWCPEEESN